MHELLRSHRRGRADDYQCAENAEPHLSCFFAAGSPEDCGCPSTSLRYARGDNVKETWRPYRIGKILRWRSIRQTRSWTGSESCTMRSPSNLAASINKS